MTSHATVVQLYVTFPVGAGEPPKLLRGFTKVVSTFGESVRATFSLSARDLSVWSVVKRAWQLTPGEFRVQIGSSSQQIELSGRLFTQ